jgi:hypothetical protein
VSGVKRGWRLALTLVAIIALAGAYLSWTRPARALDEFYRSAELAEDMLMDPLILAGDAVVPLVLREVAHPNMPRRRYAIAFLGNGGYPQALPVLRKISEDGRETAIFRADALRAIACIDANEGRWRAATISREPGFLGDSARTVATRGCDTPKRSYQQARAGSHE